MHSQTKLALFYGNCQAEPLRRLLRDSGSFPFRSITIPPVHLISKSEVAKLKALIPRTALFVHQEIRNNYRGLTADSNSLLDALPPTARSISFPVSYFKGFHPFQVYVRDSTGMNIGAPITEYHDLRFIWAAAQKWDLERGYDWIQNFGPDANRILAFAESSLNELRTREVNLDVKLSPFIDLSSYKDFHAVNHPSNRLLAAQADQILELLNAPGLTSPPSREYLGRDVSPVSPLVAAALGAASPPHREEGTFGQKRFALRELWEAAYNWYAERPDVLDRAVLAHQKSFKNLDLRN